MDEVAGTPAEPAAPGTGTPLVAFHNPRLAALQGSGSVLYAGAGEEGAPAGPRWGGGNVDFMVELWRAVTSRAVGTGSSFFWARTFTASMVGSVNRLEVVDATAHTSACLGHPAARGLQEPWPRKTLYGTRVVLMKLQCVLSGEDDIGIKEAGWTRTYLLDGCCGDTRSCHNALQRMNRYAS